MKNDKSQHKISYHKGLGWFSKLTCLATLFLIFVGSLVTSTGSGLAVPDWPLSYGTLFPPMVGGVLYEHGHRMVATLVGFLMLILALWLARVESRPWVRKLGWAALGTVIVQGLLGGITVLFFLPTAISVSHAVLAQTFFVLTIILAYVQSREWHHRVAPEDQGLVFRSESQRMWKMSIGFAAVVYLQLILGALMRHTESGLAVMDFPRMGGLWIPVFDSEWLHRINARRFESLLDPVTMKQVVIHLCHRVFGLIVVLNAIGLTVMAFFDNQIGRKIIHTVLWIDGLVALQIGLGAWTIWSEKTPVIASSHVLVGALILGVSALLGLRTLPLSAARYRLQHAAGKTHPKIRKSFERKSFVMALWSLCKPRIVSMMLVTAAFGYYLGGQGIDSWPLFIVMLVGTAFGAGGASVLNNYCERDVDAKMERTRDRPLPQKRVTPTHALMLGVWMILIGVVLLAWTVNVLTAFLVLLAAFLYVLVYTPMKRLTVWNTTVGAIPGAIPPMVGCAAATNHIGWVGWVLFFILFAWQHPHFYSLAWLLRKDYSDAGLKMLTVCDPRADKTARHILGYLILLGIVSMGPALLGLSGTIYLYGCLLMGILFFATGVLFYFSRSLVNARRIFHASLIYLPLLLILIISDLRF